MNEPNTNSEQTFPDESGEPLGPQAAAQEALNVEIDGQEPASGAGDPAQPGVGEEPAGESWEDVLRLGIGAIFGLAAMRWNSLALNEQEVDVLARAWAPVAEKHATGTVPIEAIAVLATAAVLAPKVKGAIAEEQARKAARTKNTSASQPGDPSPISSVTGQAA